MCMNYMYLMTKTTITTTPSYVLFFAEEPTEVPINNSKHCTELNQAALYSWKGSGFFYVHAYTLRIFEKIMSYEIA